MERLDKHFAALTKASFARYGFAYGELLARWPEIVGEGLSGMCEPERIRWPRGAGDAAQRQGGTLIIRAAAGCGLDLQHQVHRIIEKANQFYGYGAVTSVKIVQSHEMNPKYLKNKENGLSSDAAIKLRARLQTIADEKLRDALSRLGNGALAKRQSSPHGK
jgi:hypothetical protein